MACTPQPNSPQQPSGDEFREAWENKQSKELRVSGLGSPCACPPEGTLQGAILCPPLAEHGLVSKVQEVKGT